MPDDDHEAVDEAGAWHKRRRKSTTATPEVTSEELVEQDYVYD